MKMPPNAERRTPNAERRTPNAVRNLFIAVCKTSTAFSMSALPAKLSGLSVELFVKKITAPNLFVKEKLLGDAFFWGTGLV
jgi:hypothetical protein